MIAFLIFDLNVCGGTHKQFLKLLEYAERQRHDFIIVTKKLDFDKTYEGFRKFKDRIFVLDYYDYPNLFRHRGIRRLIPYYYRWKLKKLIKNCEIINIHDNGFEDIFPYLKGKKVYWQINDLPGAFRVGTSANIQDTEIAKREREYILKYSQDFKAISVNVAKNAMRVQDCFGRKAYIFYCGIEPIKIHRNIQESKRRFDQRKINLLSSGVFFPYRNYETQVEVVKSLVEKGYDVNLHIIGNTSKNKNYASKIQSLIDANGLTDRIIIEGQVDNKRFEYLHQNADMFLFVNIDQSWGLAVFEAMSCGLPVLVSKSVGATEILHDGTDAIFVDPKNEEQITSEVEKLVSDQDYYLRISAIASEFYKDWTWDKAYCSKMYNLMMHGN